MKFRTRVGIVVLTFGTCALAAMFQIKERAIEKEPVLSEIFDALQADIIALRAQHYQQAYLQVSSRYQGRIDLDRFAESARAELLFLRQATRWEYGVPRPSDSHINVPVYFFLTSGNVLTATFSVVRENRSWKIEQIHVPQTANPPRTIGGIRL